MITVDDIPRRPVGSYLRSLVYSTLIAASVINAYVQIVILRVMHPGTMVIRGAGAERHEIAGLELVLVSVAKTRFSLISAFVLCVVLLSIVSPVCVWLRRTRFGSRAWIMLACCALGGIVGLSLAQMAYPLAVGDNLGIVLGGISAGAFLAYYLTWGLRREASSHLD